MRQLQSRLSVPDQHALLDAVVDRLTAAPLFTPRMPRTGKPFSVAMTNFGLLGWVSDREHGYRYQSTHPDTGAPWPSMPRMLLDLWDELAGDPRPPQACLVNHYVPGARMGLHQDRDEEDLSAPVLSVSLGDDAVFRVGGSQRRGPTRSFVLKSGDIFVLAGESRLAFHGIDRLLPGTSDLLSGHQDVLPGGGRVNLTLRRVTF